MKRYFTGMVNRSRTASYSVLLAVALLLGACVAVNVKEVLEMPIAASRLQTAGTLVAVEGVVTVASGALDDGFALQDESGGIYVSRIRDAAVKTGDRVRVSGEIITPNKQITIEPARIDIMGSGSMPALADIKTGAVGPATEGRLIRVQGRIIGNVEDDQPYGWKIYLDDDSGRLLVFVATATRIDVKALRAGQQLRVTGFSGRYERHTEVLPRGAGDVVQVGASGP